MTLPTLLLVALLAQHGALEGRELLPPPPEGMAWTMAPVPWVDAEGLEGLRYRAVLQATTRAQLDSWLEWSQVAAVPALLGIGTALTLLWGKIRKMRG